MARQELPCTLYQRPPAATGGNAGAAAWSAAWVAEPQPGDAPVTGWQIRSYQFAGIVGILLPGFGHDQP